MSTDFYEIESHRARMEYLLRFAILAPSTRNTQPWSFRITDAGVEVFADFTRRLLVADCDDRELLMSVGAAIMNFRVAAAHCGCETSVSYDSHALETLPVAFISVRETCAPDQNLAALFPAIRHRHTHRVPFNEEPIDPDTLQRVCGVADEFPANLRVILPRDRARIAELIDAADRAQMARPAFREELADWIRPGASDGLSCDAVGLPRALSGAADWLMRNIATGSWRARHDRELVEHSSLLLLVAAADDRVSLVRAGEVLERLLLTVTAAGLHYSFLNQPIEVEELRDAVRRLAGCEQPAQLLLRIGIAASPAEATARRPIETVVS